MKEKQPLIREWPPIVIWIVGSVFIGIALVATPVSLIQSGLMSGSLANVDPAARTFGHISVYVIRVALVVVGVGILAIGAVKFLTPREKRRVAVSAGRQDHRRSAGIWNRSLGAMSVIWICVLLAILLGGQFFETESFSRFTLAVLPPVAGMGFIIAAGLGLGLTLRLSKVEPGRMFGCFATTAVLAVIGFGLLEMRDGSGLIYGRVATDLLTLLVLGSFFVLATLSKIPLFGGAIRSMGFPVPSPGLLLGCLLAVTVSSPVMGVIWGSISGLETGFFRLIMLSASSVVLMAELRLQIPGLAANAEVEDGMRSGVEMAG